MRGKYVIISIFLAIALSIYLVHAEDKIGDSSQGKNYCVDCHIGLSGKPRTIVFEWENSVHSKNNMQCNLCHGGNPNVDDAKKAKDALARFTGKPEKKDIPQFCGREGCHSESLKQFQQGPHYISVQKTGRPNCVDCHGDHTVKQSAFHTLSEKTCVGCHSAEFSRDIVSSISSIGKRMASVEESLEYLDKRNVENRDTAESYQKVKQYFHQVVHAFTQPEFNYSKRIIAAETEYLDELMQRRISSVKRLDIIYIITSAFSIGVIIAFIVYLGLTRRRRAKVQKNFQSR